MYAAPFAYLAPATIDEALDALREYGDEGKILAGGQSLIPLMKMRLARPAALIDINRIPDLNYVRDDGTTIRIGPLLRHRDVNRDPILAEHFPWMAGTVHLIADRQVRNLGTLIGSLVEVDPTGDWPAVMLSLDASVVLRGPGGERTVPLTEFFEFSYSPAMGDQEIVTEVRVARPGGPVRGAYRKLEKRAGDFAVAGCAVFAQYSAPGGSLASVRVALTAAGAVPFYCAEASDILLAGGGSQAAIAAAAEAILEVADPIGDGRGSAEYKRDMAAEIFRRAAAEVFLTA
jgi:carbon-monoxide dehydrogenase medium subunit